MKLGEFYLNCIEAGIRADQRGKTEIKRLLGEEKKRFEKLEGIEKELYDQERLRNPYTDCRILHGDPKTDVKRMMVGIDAHSDELLLANELNRLGRKVDLVLTHHPAGHAVKRLPEVLDIQAEQWISLGVPGHVADSIVEEKKTWALRQFHVRNSDAPVDVARILGIPFMATHTPADNHVAAYMQKKVEAAKPRTVKDLIDVILDVPEYKHHAMLQAAPTVVCGGKESRCGKVFVDMTGGINAGKQFLPELSRRGVSTLVVMHIPDESIDKAKEERMNVVIAGHIASDTLGMNLLLDNAMRGKVDIIDCSGFTRVARKAGK
jgi:putative NIF3 family GTP cyclohydrolase 1 type 2